MPDVLVRDVPDDVVAALDARAARLGISRNEYLRRRPAHEAGTDPQPVTVEHVSTGRYEVDVGGRICAVTVGLRPPYDPTNARIRP